jgi:hypothetical protein
MRVALGVIWFNLRIGVAKQKETLEWRDKDTWSSWGLIVKTVKITISRQ